MSKYATNLPAATSGTSGGVVPILASDILTILLNHNGDVYDYLDAFVAQDISAAVDPVDIKVGSVRSDLTALQGTVTTVETDFGLAQAAINFNESDIRTLEHSVADVEADVTALQTDVTAIQNSTVTKLKEQLVSGHVNLFLHKSPSFVKTSTQENSSHTITTHSYYIPIPLFGASLWFLEYGYNLPSVSLHQCGHPFGYGSAKRLLDPTTENSLDSDLIGGSDICDDGVCFVLISVNKRASALLFDESNILPGFLFSVVSTNNLLYVAFGGMCTSNMHGGINLTTQQETDVGITSSDRSYMTVRSPQDALYKTNLPVFSKFLHKIMQGEVHCPMIIADTVGHFPARDSSFISRRAVHSYRMTNASQWADLYNPLLPPDGPGEYKYGLNGLDS